MRAPAAVLSLGLAAALAPGCAPTPGAAVFTAGAARGRSVLLVTIDTLRRDRVGIYGHPGRLTPAIDRLGAEGARFTTAFSHVPATLPAHASILTGRLPTHHGLRLNGAARLGGDIPTLATVLGADGYQTGAFVGAFVLDARYGLARGFDVYDDRYPQQAIGRTFAFAERRGADVVAAAGDWITAPDRRQPWFAWVHLFDPHAPYEAPPEFGASRAPYDAEVAYVDAMLARLIERLAATGRLAETLVVVTADHGESLAEHGETTHGLFAYDATLAVPLLIRGPGVGPGVVDAPVGHVDIVPTLLALVGAPAPAGLDGQSATTVLPATRPIYFEALDAHLTRDWAPLTGVTDGRWKFVQLPVPELYDRVADPGETRNLAASDAGRAASLERQRRPLAESAAPPVAAAPLDAAAEQRLRSLGYVGASAAQSVARTARPYTPADDPKHLAPLNERFDAALAAYGGGRTAESLAALMALVEERPDFTVARTTAATVLSATGRADDAVALLRRAPAAVAGSADIQARLGAILAATGRAAEAIASLERARAAGYANPELLNDLGVAYVQAGRADDARAAFTALVQLDPDAAAAWSNLGLLELSSRRPDAAADAFRKAVASDPSRGDAWQGLGAALIDRDRAAAVDAWQHAERLVPADYDLLFNLGMVLAQGPRPQEAVPYLTRFRREAPRARYARDLATVDAALRKVGR